MKIVHVVSGSGGSFYCGNCMRDNIYVQSLRDLGSDVIMLPMYLPLNVNDFGSTGDAPVFFGAVGLYLRHMLPFFRKMPGWMRRWLDRPALLSLAAKKAGSTRATGLEQMTLSMLRGEEGGQKEDLEMLAEWLAQEDPKPDIIHLSNALLIGLSKKLKQQTGASIVVSLQDEDTWLDVMREPYRSQCWQIMAERERDVDAFVTTSRYFSDFMQEKAQYPAHKVHVVQPGIHPGEFQVAPPIHPPVIGFLSRLCPGNGLDILIHAFIKLHHDFGLRDTRLKLTGGYTGDDRPFLRKMKKILNHAGLEDKYEIIDDFYGESRQRFLQSITVLSVPVPKGEAMGIYQLEALASAVPLVQPKVGAFPEIIEQTQGGFLYHPNTPDVLAETLAKLLASPQKIRATGLNGRKQIESRFNSHNMAKAMLKVYGKIRGVS